jgi:hypothetical protein
MTREFQLERAARELLEQIDMLECVELSRDLPTHEAEACWDDAISRLRKLLEPATTREGWTEQDYLTHAADMARASA